MFKLILAICAIYLAVRLIKEKYASDNNSTRNKQSDGNIIEGEVVEDDKDESNNGENT